MISPLGRVEQRFRIAFKLSRCDPSNIQDQSFISEERTVCLSLRRTATQTLFNVHSREYDPALPLGPDDIA